MGMIMGAAAGIALTFLAANSKMHDKNDEMKQVKTKYEKQITTLKQQLEEEKKAEKYVAQNVITNTVDFRDLCEEITKVGMVPSGAVKFVLDALIDTLNLNLRKGISVQLGDFGCFRPGMNCESQDAEKDVDSDTIRRVKIIFTPGYKFKEMLSKVSVQKAVASDDGSISPEQPDPNPNPNPDDGKGEAPDPAA